MVRLCAYVMAGLAALRLIAGVWESMDERGIWENPRVVGIGIGFLLAVPLTLLFGVSILVPGALRQRSVRRRHRRGYFLWLAIPVDQHPDLVSALGYQFRPISLIPGTELVIVEKDGLVAYDGYASAKLHFRVPRERIKRVGVERRRIITGQKMHCVTFAVEQNGTWFKLSYGFHSGRRLGFVIRKRERVEAIAHECARIIDAPFGEL